MRKLRRRAFNTLTLLSLLLCIAMAGVWVRSYQHYFGIEWQAEYDGRIFAVHRRLMCVNRGVLLAQSRYGEMFDSIFFISRSGPPKHLGSSYFERRPLSDKWLDQFSYVANGGVHTTEIAGFKVSYPAKTQIETAAGRTLIYELILPLWSLTLLFALLPSLSLLRLIRRRRIPPGHCPHCSYNLHANLSGACPECGQPTAPAEPRRV